MYSEQSLSVILYAKEDLFYVGGGESQFISMILLYESDLHSTCSSIQFGWAGFCLFLTHTLQMFLAVKC